MVRLIMNAHIAMLSSGMLKELSRPHDGTATRLFTTSVVDQAKSAYHPLVLIQNL